MDLQNNIQNNMINISINVDTKGVGVLEEKGI